MSRRFERQYASKGVLVDRGLGVMFDWGTAIPVDGTGGYSEGCLFIKSGGAAGAQVYVNQGTLTSCQFKALPAN